MTEAGRGNDATAERCDVVVIGGGPAGSTVATLLAREGHSVVLLEKARHPRFHVGESLLPANIALFDRLGVRDAVERIGMPKYGIEFVSPEYSHSSHLEFADGWDKSLSFSFQVRRSELDEILFRHAGACGARTLEGARVSAVALDDDGATVSAEVTTADGRKSARQWRARFVVDASGRDTLLARQLGLRQRNAAHNSSALFGHFRGARRLEGRRAGNISIFWFAHGWFWFIPLADGTDSVGAVCWPGYLKSRDKPLKEFFFDTIALCPALEERMRGATLEGDRVHATGNYCYSATSCSGPRWLIVGDAFAFIDPVFSTGVYLAMQGAFDAAATVATALDRPEEYEAARARFESAMRFGPREYTWFIVRMTSASIRHLFMHPSNPMRVYEAMMSLLAGDIYGRTPIWSSLRAFKAIYYAVSLRHPVRTARGWWKHRAQIRDEGPLRGETIIGAD